MTAVLHSESHSCLGAKTKVIVRKSLRNKVTLWQSYIVRFTVVTVWDIQFEFKRDKIAIARYKVPMQDIQSHCEI